MQLAIEGRTPLDVPTGTRGHSAHLTDVDAHQATASWLIAHEYGARAVWEWPFGNDQEAVLIDLRTYPL